MKCISYAYVLKRMFWVIEMRFVPSNCMRPGQKLASDLKMYDDRVFLRKRIILTEPLIRRIKMIGFQGAYVDDDISRDLIVAGVISEDIKVKAKKEIKTLFSFLEKNDHDRFAKTIGTIKDILGDMVEQILKNSKTMINLVDLRTYDDYTYSHCLNVSVLSVVMGTVLGLGKKSLNDLAVAGLVHDIGKVFIDKNIVNKPARLTDEEFQEMKKHSERGYQYLKRYSKFSKNIMKGVLDHHEQYKGEGYPKGLKGDDISLFGRIICVADVFDALTSDRPYRRAMIPSDAIEYIMSGYDTMFDPQIVDVFLKKVAAYPIGTCVGLSNGKTGIVIKNHEGFGLRPIINIVEKGVLTEHIIDLNNVNNDMLNITIQEIVNL